MVLVTHLLHKFNEAFGSGTIPARVFFAPGRLCLIGEHIDYNGGLVLPAAISLGIYAVARVNNQKRITFISDSQPGIITLNPEEEIVFTPEYGWGNYPAGVLKKMQEAGYNLGGADVFYLSTLPAGAGLSSSAALEVLTAFVFDNLFGNGQTDRVRMALLCKEAENDFVGVRCGLMDQFAVAMGKANHALLLNCSSLEYAYVPAHLNDYVMLIFNTNKERRLAESVFNIRVQECGTAFQQISRHRPVACLADAAFKDAEQWIPESDVQKRALHVIAENQRVQQAATALRNGDILRFGELLLQSHASLRNLYEVTGPELDALVDAAKSQPECIGAKMSGAGFGGCAFALVKKEKADLFKMRVLEAYRRMTGFSATCYMAELVDGVRKIEPAVK
ncbi:MAG: galactokinase [Chitinophagales bacterium]|nr:MAG: galactokinase [Chitinophagales bacterium]